MQGVAAVSKIECTLWMEHLGRPFPLHLCLSKLHTIILLGGGGGGGGGGEGGTPSILGRLDAISGVSGAEGKLGVSRLQTDYITPVRPS